MKTLFIGFLLLVSAQASSQNYQCLQSGIIRYFHNGSVRAIKMDSVTVSASETIFYPFRSLRGSYGMAGGLQQLDSNGGSWIGKKIVLLQDGTTQFETYWGDTVIVQSQAGTGSSWMFYDDTTSRYYTATVTSVDTMTVLGNLDSVKTILISAYQNGAINPADMVHGKTIRISKNQGLVETFSLYMFPFHPPSIGSYQQGHDYLMDQLDVVNGTVTSYHLFKLADSTFLSVYDFAPGDVFEYKGLSVTSATPPKQIWHFDSVISKTINATTTDYQITRFTKIYQPPYNLYPPSTTYNYSTYQRQTSNAPILGFIPEEKWNPMRFFINQSDTTHCATGVTFTIDNGLFADMALEPCYKIETFKMGVGRIKYSECFDPAGKAADLYLIYYKKNNIPCGNFTPITAIQRLDKSVTKIYPNPASDYLHIDNSKGYQYHIIDLFGRIVMQGQLDEEEKINVLSLPRGSYLLKLFSTPEKVFTQTFMVR